MRIETKYLVGLSLFVVTALCVSTSYATTQVSSVGPLDNKPRAPKNESIWHDSVSLGVAIKSLVLSSERGGKIALECDAEQFGILKSAERLHYFEKAANIDSVRCDEILKKFGNSFCDDRLTGRSVLRLKKIESLPEAIEFEIEVRSQQLTREDETGHEGIIWYAVRSEKWRVKGSELDMLSKSEWIYSNGSVQLHRP